MFSSPHHGSPSKLLGTQILEYNVFLLEKFEVGPRYVSIVIPEYCSKAWRTKVEKDFVKVAVLNFR